jgi:ABC-type transporter lipoprotein component MlaA
MNTINKIQSIINYWYNIKTDKQYQKFTDMVKNTTFGTYGTISVQSFYVDNEGEFKHVNEYHRKQFKKELENIF